MSDRCSGCEPTERSAATPYAECAERDGRLNRPFMERAGDKRVAVGPLGQHWRCFYACFAHSCGREKVRRSRTVHAARDAAGENPQREGSALPRFLEDRFIRPRRVSGAPSRGSFHVGDTIHGTTSHMRSTRKELLESYSVGRGRCHGGDRPQARRTGRPHPAHPRACRPCVGARRWTARRGRCLRAYARIGETARPDC